MVLLNVSRLQFPVFVLALGVIILIRLFVSLAFRPVATGLPAVRLALLSAVEHNLAPTAWLESNAAQSLHGTAMSTFAR